MIINKIKTLLSLLVVFVFLLFNEVAYASIFIEGKKSDIDLSDLLYPDRKITDETDIRKLCAAITERYHTNGYTAFKIINVFIKKDGSVKLHFSDPVVDRILVTGADPDNERIAAEIFLKKKAFNEFILNYNITKVKKQYSLIKVSVELKKNEYGNIEIYIIADKRRYSGSFMAASDPVYGGVTSLALTYFYRTSSLSAVYDTTANFNEINYNHAMLDYHYSLADCSWLTFILALHYKDKKIISDEYQEEKYNSKTFESETGFSINKDEILFSIRALFSRVNFGNYSETDKNYYFPGIFALFIYNDKKYRIDPLDVIAAEINTGYIWNPVEKNMAARMMMKGYLTIPVHYMISLSACINSNYTTEKERIFHDYVFDRTLPVKNREFITSQWRNVIRTGLMFDVYSRLVYISPEFLGGIYSYQKKSKTIHAASFRGILKNEFFLSEIAYIVQSYKKFHDGVISFEFKAVF